LGWVRVCETVVFCHGGERIRRGFGSVQRGSGKRKDGNGRCEASRLCEREKLWRVKPQERARDEISSGGEKR